MTREQVAIKIYNKYCNNSISCSIEFYEIILTRLEEMNLIKFESEREAVIKEAEKYIEWTGSIAIDANNIFKMLKIIKCLVALLK